MRVLAVCLMVVLTGCATQKGNDRQAQHAADQIRMVAIQREARAKERQAEAANNTALVEALARVAEANPEHAPSVAVALAVIGVQGADGEDDDAPIVTLQQQRNVGLEYVRVLATPVSALLTGVAVAGIQADVQKNASDNNRDILLGDQLTDAAIVSSVAGLGEAAASSIGISAGGDIYQVSDNASIDQSENTTDSYNTTTTTETTTTTSTDVSLSTTLNYDGSNMTLAQLIEQLQNAGASYSIEFDGVEVASGEGEGETLVVDCNSGFSPNPPGCV